MNRGVFSLPHGELGTGLGPTTAVLDPLNLQGIFTGNVGDTVDLIMDSVNAVVWRMVYTGLQPNPWSYVGGGAMVNHAAAGGSTTSGSPVTVGTPPIINFPCAMSGLFEANYGIRCFLNIQDWIHTYIYDLSGNLLGDPQSFSADVKVPTYEVNRMVTRYVTVPQAQPTRGLTIRYAVDNARTFNIETCSLNIRPVAIRIGQ